MANLNILTANEFGEPTQTQTQQQQQEQQRRAANTCSAYQRNSLCMHVCACVGVSVGVQRGVANSARYALSIGQFVESASLST